MLAQTGKVACLKQFKDDNEVNLKKKHKHTTPNVFLR